MTTETTTDGGAGGADAGATAMTGADDQTTAATTEGNDTDSGATPGDNQTPGDDAGTGSADDDKSQQKDSESDDENQNGQQSDTPTEYSDFTLPEGFDVNEEVMGEFKGLLGDVEKETGQPLSQEHAQKFVDMGAKLVQEGVEMAMQNAAEYHAQQAEANIKAFKEDAEVGGTEEAQKQSLSAAKAVAKALGGDALLKALDETGAGNRVEIIKAFWSMRDFVGEDGNMITATQGGGSSASHAQKLYPNQ